MKYETYHSCVANLSNLCKILWLSEHGKILLPFLPPLNSCVDNLSNLCITLWLSEHGKINAGCQKTEKSFIYEHSLFVIVTCDSGFLYSFIILLEQTSHSHVKIIWTKSRQGPIKGVNFSVDSVPVELLLVMWRQLLLAW